MEAGDGVGPHQPMPTAAPWCRQPLSSLWVQVRPSQPSRQMQEKESPLPTQVPPFTQGLGKQLLFLAAKESEKESRKRRKGSHLSQAGRGPRPRPRPRQAQPSPGPHRQCRCCPSSPGGRHSGRCPRCRSTCRRCCRCRRHTGTHLRAHSHSEAARSSGRRPGRQCSPQSGRAWWALTRMAGLALPAIVAHAVEVVDQVEAATAAVAGIGEAVVGIWGRGRRSAGVPGVQGGLPGGGGTGVGQGAAEERGGSVCTPLPAFSMCCIPVGGSTHGARPTQGTGRGSRGGVRCGRGARRAQHQEAQALRPRVGQCGPLTGVTELALPATGAEAAEGVHLVDAGAPVAARLAQAVVDVCGR